MIGEETDQAANRSVIEKIKLNQEWAMMNLGRRKFFQAVLTLNVVLTLALTGCDGGGDSSGSEDSGPKGSVIESVTETVSSSEGGVISLNSGAQIQIPAGALSEDTPITMTETTDASMDKYFVADNSFNGKYYELLPNEFLMSKKSIITIPFGELPADVSADDLVIEYFDGESWLSLSNITVNTVAKTISGSTDHFTTFKVSWVGKSEDYKITNNLETKIEDGYLRFDLNVEGPIDILAKRSLGNLSLFKYNKHSSVAYKIDLINATDGGKIVRSIHVYSMMYQQRFELDDDTPSIIFNGTDAKLKYKRLLNDLRVFYWEIKDSAGDQKFRTVHHVNVFDDKGVLKENGKKGQVWVASDAASVQNDGFDDQLTNYFYRPMKSDKARNAIPASEIEEGKKYQFRIKIQSINDGKLGDSKAEFITNKAILKSSDPEILPGKFNQFASIKIRPPQKPYLEDQTLSFVCDISNSGHVVNLNDGSMALKWYVNDKYEAKGIRFDHQFAEGTHNVRAEYADQYNAKSSHEITIDVDKAADAPEDLNQPPIITTLPTRTVIEGERYEYNADHADPEDDPVRYSLVSGPAGLKVLKKTGRVIWDTNLSHGGNSYSVTIQIDDGHENIVTQSFEIAVLNENHAPMIDSMYSGLQPVKDGDMFLVYCDSHDPDNDPLTYTWSGSGDFSSNDLGDGRLTVHAQSEGRITIECLISDGEAQDYQRLEIKVLENKQLDFDGDGYSPANEPVDCDDNNYWINPDATEDAGNAIDENCDGIVESLPPSYWYKDEDGDGFADIYARPEYSSTQPTNYYPIEELQSGDCNDGDSEIYPGQTEFENGHDDNCDGQVDEGFTAPGKISGVEANANLREVTVTWSSIAGATGYYLVCSTDPDFALSPIKMEDVSSPYVVTDLDYGETYYFSIVSTNSYGESDYSDPAVSSILPFADPSGDQTVMTGTLVELDGSNSVGSGLLFTWSFSSKPSGSLAELSNTEVVDPYFIADLAGTYTFQLLVSDGNLISEPGTVVITAVENLIPVANAGSDETAEIDTTFYLDGSGSTDADGHELTFSWALVSKPSGSTAYLSDDSTHNPYFTADRPGQYRFSLTVNDGYDDSAADEVIITVEGDLPRYYKGSSNSITVIIFTDPIADPPDYTIFSSGVWSAIRTGSSVAVVYTQTSPESGAGTQSSFSGTIVDEQLVSGFVIEGISCPITLTFSDSGSVSGSFSCSDDSNPAYEVEINGSISGDEVFEEDSPYVDNQNGTITNTDTGLMITSAENQEIGWLNANTYCSGLTTGGFSDWRLPTRVELMEIYNDQSLLGFTLASDYWSSEEIEGVDAAWNLNVGDGLLVPVYKTYPSNVRCFRKEAVGSLTGTWSGTYSWDCGSYEGWDGTQYSLVGSRAITFELVQDSFGYLSGTASYMGGQSDLVNWSIRGTNPEYGDFGMVGLELDSEGDYVKIEHLGSDSFVGNAFYGQIDGNTISGTTLNGDSELILTQDEWGGWQITGVTVGGGNGCSAPYSPSGTFILTKQ